MDLDDPNVPEFASWRSYEKFTGRVRNRRRYVWGTEVQRFLDTVLATLRVKERNVQIPEGKVLYRAQLGVQYSPVYEQDGTEIAKVPTAYSANRMKPLRDRAREGRANPVGIPVLYVASTPETAVCEIRPWIGSYLSIAHFKVLRNLSALDLTRGCGRTSLRHLTFEFLEGKAPLSAERKEKAVWSAIDNAFSRPVLLSDDAADYAPTQILVELFEDAGYDAIIYRSKFGKNTNNIALFNIDDAEAIAVAPYEVTSVDVKVEKTGALWISKEHFDLKTMKST